MKEPKPLKVVVVSGDDIEIAACREVFCAKARPVELVAFDTERKLLNPFSAEAMSFVFARAGAGQRQVPDADLYIGIQQSLYGLDADSTEIRHNTLITAADGRGNETLAQTPMVILKGRPMRDCLNAAIESGRPLGAVLHEAGLVKHADDLPLSLTGTSRVEHVREAVQRAVRYLGSAR